ncbi:hypothetical protein RhiirA4_479510 [Rhizophagus irregularis]|uniref:Uncharacterized protein n=1 Tax=Rhizophagus irregularis TaxID=588596 RepID=A0A2I1HGK0_9GLOM|nr:hypothetical protein RhiirA4_479510 [Rhizophagus irregularis]
MSIADSSDKKKISLHVLTSGMRLPNIAQVAMFTELICKKLPEGLQGKGIIDNIANKRSFSLQMIETPKFDEKTGEYIRVKKAILPKDGTIFDFMLCPPNDKSEVIESPLLVIPESESISHSSMGVDAIEVELKLVEKLL